MRRFFITFIILALFVCALAVPAFATWEEGDIEIIDFLDYVDRDHLVVNGDEKQVIIDIPSDKGESVFIKDGANDYVYGSYDDAYLGPDANPFRFSSYPLIEYQIKNGRFSTGYLLDVSSLPDGATVLFDWEIGLEGFTGNIDIAGQYPDFYYTCFFFDEATDGSPYFYQKGRSHISTLSGKWVNGKLDCMAIYQHGYGTVGTATDYISPFCAYNDLLSTYLPNSFYVRVSSIRVHIPIDDSLISIAQNEKTQKLLDEVNRQLEEQGKTMQDVLKEQELTNDKLDGVHGAIDDTNEKLDDITDYKPEVETPEGGEVVGDLEEVEDNLMDDVNDGFDKAEDLQLSVLETLLQYVTAFGAVSYIIDLFAWIPFIKILLSVSLALGIVSTLLNIGLSVSSGASKSKSDGKHGAKDKHSAGH